VEAIDSLSARLCQRLLG